jgi:hypothetical protein
VAEDTQYDPMAGTAEQSTSTPTVAEPDALGAGFFDTDDEDSTEPVGQSEEGQDPAETPQADDKTKPDEGTLRWDDYSRKTAALADERRQWQQERQQRDDAFQAKQEAWLQEQRQALSPQGQQGSLADRVRQVANSGELSEQDRAGLGVIADLAQELESMKAENAELRALTPRFRQTFQQVESLTAAQNSVLKANLTEQFNESVGAFGEETTRAAGDFIRRNIDDVNPHTGKTFTIPELVAMFSGKTAQEARDARGRFTSQQAQAKNGAAARGSHPSSAPSNGAISRDQALAEMKATGLT